MDTVAPFLIGRTVSLAGYCVVVVEDRNDSRELMRVALENAGAAVALFDRSAKALDAFEKISRRQSGRR